MQGSRIKCYVKRDKPPKGSGLSHYQALKIPGLELRNALSPCLRCNSAVRVDLKCCTLG